MFELYIDSVNKNDKLKDQLKIFGLTYIEARCRALNNFQLIYNLYTHQRNRRYQDEETLQRCRANGAILVYWRDQLLARYEKWKAKTHNARQLIINLNQQILHIQNNPLPNPLIANMAAIQDVMLLLALLLTTIPQYIEQE